MIFEDEGQVVLVPVIVKPVVVRHPATIVHDRITNIQIAIRVGELCIQRHLCHHPRNHLEVEFYAGS